ncbi:COG1361 S-layer family protein [Kribbella sp. WER1]
MITSGLVLPATARADTVRDFGKVFGAQTNGAVRITGNSLLTCDRSDAGCRDSLAGGRTKANNNDWNMELLDLDSDPSTKSSSGATVALPNGAQVLYAGLFWGAARGAGRGGTSTSDDGTTMRLRLPGTSSYQTVTADRTDYLNTGSKNDYSSYLDVTDLVRAGGNGEYWGADVPTGTGADRYAGWSLVIAYQQADEPLRDLSVFNGYAKVSSGEPVRTNISGFLAPPSGAVNARFGSVTYEGDAGITGDYFAVNGTRLADAQNPSANFYGSRVTDGGENLADRTPASVNNLGVDAKVVDAAGVLPNNATSAELTFASTGDVYYPAALTTQIDLYAPTIVGTKTVRNLEGNTPAKVGDTLEYTLSFSNTGDDDALRSAVRDELPANTTFVPGSLAIVSGAGAGSKTDGSGDDQADYGGRTVRFRIGTGANATTGGRLAKDQSTTVRFRVTVDKAAAGTTLNNVGLLDYTAETLNKQYTYRTDEVLTPVAAEADVSITKTAKPDPVAAGGELTYTLVARNNGPSAAEDVKVTDTLPDGVTLVSAKPTQGSCTATTCELGTINSGSTATITVVVRVSAATTVTSLTNVATVTSSTSDPNLDNNTSSVTTDVTRTADLQIVKTVAPAHPAPGESVVFTLAVKNNGPSDAEQVRIADAVPAGFTITGVQSTATCTTAGRDVNCTLARLAAGASVSVRIAATLDAGYQGGALTNTAKTVSDTPDPDDSNNTDTVTITPAAPKADVVVTKTTVTKPVVAGEPITYQIKVHNTGPSTAKNVNLSDVVPSALTDVTADTSAGSCTVSSGRVACPMGDLPVGETAIVTVTGTVSPKAVGDLTNSATAESSTPDPDTSNNTGRTTDTVKASADLAITKTAQPVPVHAGQPVTYTLTVTNNGPSAAQSVKVTDPVPSPLQYVSAKSSAGTCTEASGTVTCAVGTVAPGDTVTVTVVADVPSGTEPNDVKNTATVSSPTPDPVTGNNTATHTITTGTQANITITKTASPDPVVAGKPITYKLTVRNTGPSDAQGIRVVDDVPDAITGVQASGDGGATCTAVNGQVRCLAATLAAGDSFVVTVTGTVAAKTPAGELANTATATSETPTDPTTSDNTSTTTPSVRTEADLSIVKTAPATAVAGDELTYTLAVRNAGPSDAVGTIVTDPLPAGTTFVRAAGCTHENEVVSCSVGRLAPGDGTTITVVVKVSPDQPAGTLTNKATVSSQTPDPNDSNNSSTAETTLTTAADLSIAKTVKPSPLVAGGEAVYTLTVHNDGPSTAQQASVKDAVPSGLTVLEATSADGTCTTANAAVTCELGEVAPNGDAVVVIRVAVAASQTAAVTNGASVDSPTTDPDPSNNKTEVTTEVEQAADVEVIKSSDEPTVIAGGGVTYRLTVVNHGPSDATAVTAADSLPTPLKIVSVDPQCTATGQTVRCALGTLAAGKAVTVVITATLDPAYQGTSLANTATATSPVPDPDESNNSSTITTPVETLADVSVVKTSDPTGVTPGSAFDYTIVVNNAGPSTARAVVLSDTVPAGLTVTSASKGCTVKGRAVSCQLGDLPIGQVVLVLHVRLAAGYEGASVVNTASETSRTTDPDPSNDTDTAESPVTALADLAITKTMSPAAPVAGQSVKYVLTVKNNGPSHARTVTITDELPRGLSNVTMTGNACILLPPEAPGAPDTPAAGTVRCTTPELAVGATVTVTVTATVVPGFTGSLENLARVGAATPDPVIANNEAKVSGRTTQSANLSVQKTASAPTVIAGHTLDYTIAVHNAGPSSATAVTITDVLPNGLSLTSTPKGCATTGQKVTCAVGRVDPGVTAKVTLTVLVNTTATTVANTAKAESPTADPDPNNNTSTVTVRVTPPQPGRPKPNLPNTGSDVSPAILLAALALLTTGLGAIAFTRRRRG